MRGKRTLEESLDLYVQGELMEGDNQYLCEEAGKKVPLCFHTFAAFMLASLKHLCSWVFKMTWIHTVVGDLKVAANYFDSAYLCLWGTQVH